MERSSQRGSCLERQAAFFAPLMDLYRICTEKHLYITRDMRSVKNPDSLHDTRALLRTHMDERLGNSSLMLFFIAPVDYIGIGADASSVVTSRTGATDTSFTF